MILYSQEISVKKVTLCGMAAIALAIGASGCERLPTPPASVMEIAASEPASTRCFWTPTLQSPRHTRFYINQTDQVPHGILSGGTMDDSHLSYDERDEVGTYLSDEIRLVEVQCRRTRA